ncbi:MAG: geranylgeranylglyceryl/heptaprenylglyceryl phosphate synthase [Chitinophagales bacterium]|nr:geranylgeranylglyceryl/heptaprenylglyceryl phosphate synthase [Chitinophagales bacterium]
MSLLQSFNDGKKKLAVLIDPDNYDEFSLKNLLEKAVANKVSYLLVGGSLLYKNQFHTTVEFLKENSTIPVIIFPGNSFQVSEKADGILFLSLVSGRNPAYLIGEQVIAAPAVQQANIEVIPTAYILIEGGKISATSYITQTIPIPAQKPEIAATTALAASFLGMKVVYLEAGSGAETPVNSKVITAVKKTVNLPLIVGGGITNVNAVSLAFNAGADMVVIGNVLEANPKILDEIGLFFNS